MNKIKVINKKKWWLRNLIFGAFLVLGYSGILYGQLFPYYVKFLVTTGIAALFLWWEYRHAHYIQQKDWSNELGSLALLIVLVFLLTLILR